MSRTTNNCIPFPSPSERIHRRVGPREPLGETGAHRIVAAVRLDRASAQGLLWAHALGRALGLEVDVLHVLRRTEAPATTLGERSLRVRGAKAAVQEWALHEAGIALPGDSIQIRVGDVAQRVSDFAREEDATLVVVGGPLDSDDEGAGALTTRIVATAVHPVLVAGPKRGTGAFLVATDLEHVGAPVLRVGARFARQLRRRLSVIHHLDEDGAIHDLGGYAPEHMALRLDVLRRLARELHVDDATVIRTGLAGDGILRVARTRDVDVVVIGVRARAGLTSRWILAAARRSVLVVPIS